MSNKEYICRICGKIASLEYKHDIGSVVVCRNHSKEAVVLAPHEYMEVKGPSVAVSHYNYVNDWGLSE